MCACCIKKCEDSIHGFAELLYIVSFHCLKSIPSYVLYEYISPIFTFNDLVVSLELMTQLSWQRKVQRKTEKFKEIGDLWYPCSPPLHRCNKSPTSIKSGQSSLSSGVTFFSLSFSLCLSQPHPTTTATYFIPPTFLLFLQHLSKPSLPSSLWLADQPYYFSLCISSMQHTSNPVLLVTLKWRGDLFTAHLL